MSSVALARALAARFIEIADRDDAFRSPATSMSAAIAPAEDGPIDLVVDWRVDECSTRPIMPSP